MICPVCDLPIRDLSADMHEVIITRGHAPKEKQIQIFTEENCVLVHHGECHVVAATREGKHKCVAYLIRWNGKENILNWIDSLDLGEETKREARYVLQSLHKRNE